MFVDLLKGFLVGMCASAPIGPIAILVVQKSLSKGHKAGFVSGLGASVVDTLYASIAIFALAFAQKFIEDHQSLILLVGGAVLIIVGVSMAFSDPFRKMKADGESSVSPKDFGQAVAMGLSNPMAIFVMFTLFAFFGLADDSPHNWKVAPIILSVSLGSVTYWFSMSWLLSRFRSNFRMRTILWISRITGALIVIIGIALLGQGLFNVAFRGMPII
ncbi:MAG: LysE family transporter [Bacteroidales bacterium]|nr:LysE family transporter [Bacteroidales bacterium]MBQ3612683.1 LysE family transporter [Bacteroidales bacterium]